MPDLVGCLEGYSFDVEVGAGYFIIIKSQNFSSMKKIATLPALWLLFATPFFAQEAVHTPNWQIAKFGIALGGDIDMPLGLDYNYLLNTAEEVDFDYSELAYDKGEMTNMNCDNGTFRLNMSFRPFRSADSELQLSFLSIDGRIDKVRYESPNGQYLEVSAANEETALEALFLKNSRAGRSWRFHAGLGTNVGYSHGGEIQVKGHLLHKADSDVPNTLEEVDYKYRQSDGINQRLFLQGGMAVRFLKRLEFGFECRKGLGYRASFGGPFNMTLLKRSLGFSFRYQIIP
jgi:hypothetical protein